MKLTILGKYGPYPKGKGACSGYIIEWENNKILLDCGNGTLSRYFELGHKLKDLTAIIISHLHADHISDLLVLRYALLIEKSKGRIDKKIPLYSPHDPYKFFEEFYYKGLFDVNIIKDKEVIVFNNTKIKFNKMNHSIESYSTTIEYKNKKFIYTGDTDYFDGIEEIFKDASLLLCEGGILESQKKGKVPHLSVKEACEAAQKSKVKRLILTHIYPENNYLDILEEGNKYYNGILEVAKERQIYFI